MSQTAKQRLQTGPQAPIRDRLKTGLKKLSIVGWDARMRRWAAGYLAPKLAGHDPTGPGTGQGSLNARIVEATGASMGAATAN